MPRWAEIALTLVLFAVVMSAASWVVNATVPGVDAWLVDRIGSAGVWALLATIFIAAVTYGIYDHRRAGARAKGR